MAINERVFPQMCTGRGLILWMIDFFSHVQSRHAYSTGVANVPPAKYVILGNVAYLAFDPSLRSLAEIILPLNQHRYSGSVPITSYSSVAQTVQQHVSYAFIWIRRTYVTNLVKCSLLRAV